MRPHGPPCLNMSKTQSFLFGFLMQRFLQAEVTNECPLEKLNFFFHYAHVAHFILVETDD